MASDPGGASRPSAIAAQKAPLKMTTYGTERTRSLRPDPAPIFDGLAIPMNDALNLCQEVSSRFGGDSRLVYPRSRPRKFDRRTH